MHYNLKAIFLASVFSSFVLTLFAISLKANYIIIGDIKLKVPYECFFISFIGIFVLILIIIFVKQILCPKK